MMHYGQFCPTAKAAEIFAERWTPLVVQELLAGSTRFNDIRRGLPLISQTLLSHRLKELERVGIVERRGDARRAREYHLTEAGIALGPVIRALSEWGLQYAQDPLEEGDLDVTVLVWNIKRRVDPSVFAERRVTVHFEFTDVPKNKSQWWVVNNRGIVDLCATDPGFPVDLYITTDIRTMIAIWFGKLAWEAGVHSGRVEVMGERQLSERLRSWFLLNPVRVVNVIPQSAAKAYAADHPVPEREPTQVLHR
jgi:DNA-binding HxlR family transcriptional regulator